MGYRLLITKDPDHSPSFNVRMRAIVLLPGLLTMSHHTFSDTEQLFSQVILPKLIKNLNGKICTCVFLWQHAIDTWGKSGKTLLVQEQTQNHWIVILSLIHSGFDKTNIAIL